MFVYRMSVFGNSIYLFSDVNDTVRVCFAVLLMKLGYLTYASNVYLTFALIQ